MPYSPYKTNTILISENVAPASSAVTLHPGCFSARKRQLPARRYRGTFGFFKVTVFPRKARNVIIFNTLCGWNKPVATTTVL